MKDNKSWKTRFNISSKHSSCNLREALQQEFIQQEDYQTWASYHHNMPILTEQYFKDYPLLNQKLWKQYPQIWNQSLLPVLEWENTVYVASLEPSDIQIGKQIVFLLTHTHCLEKLWKQSLKLDPMLEKKSQSSLKKDHSADDAERKSTSSFNDAKKSKSSFKEENPQSSLKKDHSADDAEGKSTSSVNDAKKSKSSFEEENSQSSLKKSNFSNSVEKKSEDSFKENRSVNDGDDFFIELNFLQTLITVAVEKISSFAQTLHSMFFVSNRGDSLSPIHTKEKRKQVNQNIQKKSTDDVHIEKKWNQMTQNIQKKSPTSSSKVNKKDLVSLSTPHLNKDLDISDSSTDSKEELEEKSISLSEGEELKAEEKNTSKESKLEEQTSQESEEKSISLSEGEGLKEEEKETPKDSEKEIKISLVENSEIDANLKEPLKQISSGSEDREKIPLSPVEQKKEIKISLVENSEIDANLKEPLKQISSGSEDREKIPLSPVEQKKENTEKDQNLHEETLSKKENTSFTNSTTSEKKERSELRKQLEETKKHIDSYILFLFKKDQFIPYKWSENLNPSKAVKGIIKNPSIFRICYTSKQPYCGKVAPVISNNSFFENWGYGTLPSYVVMIPFFGEDKKVMGAYLGISKDHVYSVNFLSFIEKLVEPFSEFYKEPKILKKIA